MTSQLPSPTATPSEHRRKIRDSCNNCSAQKIRCGKQRPACARCVTKNLQCNYSYSQRTGRRSSSMSSAQKDGSTIALLPTIADSPVTKTETNDIFASMHSTSSLSMDIDPFEDSQFFPDMNFDFLTSPNTTETVTSHSSLSNNDIIDTAHIFDPEALWNNLPTTFDSSYTFDTTLKSVSSHPIFSSEDVAVFRRNIEKTNPPGHDCMTLALQVVNDLSVVRETCSTANQDPMTGIEAAGKTELRDVDAVLFINRDAAQSVKKILDCTCSGDQSVLLACYLATSKIVDWYGAAIEAVGERSDEDSYSKRGLAHNISEGAMANRIIARPIFMGKYCLDSEVQRVVRAQVVLGELKEHIQPLLNRLPRYHVTGLDADSEATTANAQACVLRNQLRQVIQNARNLNGSN